MYNWLVLETLYRLAEEQGLHFRRVVVFAIAAAAEDLAPSALLTWLGALPSLSSAGRSRS